MPKRRKTKLTKSVSPAVSEYMAEMARKSHASLKGTETAKLRASKAAKARWAKYKAEKDATKPEKPIS
jgi:hypothetical protein